MSVGRLFRLLGKATLLGILFGATLEVCARVEDAWRWGAPFWGAYSSDLLGVSDEIGARNRPGARFEKWVINRAGFRGPELSEAKAAGVVRVGIAGASEIFGLNESPERDVTAQLRALLETSAPGRYEVVNLASAGMSLPRFGELFERWARRFNFDLIVLYPTPAFYLDLEPPRRHLPPAKGASAPPSFSLRAPDKIWRALRGKLPPKLQAWLKRTQLERTRRAHPPEWVWSVAPPERVALFTTDVTALVQSLQAAGVRVVLAIHAHPFTPPLSPDESLEMDAWIRFYPRATAEALIDMERKARESLLEIGEKNGIPVVDLQAALGKDRQNYADFSHFTDRGASTVATTLAPSILVAAQ